MLLTLQDEFTLLKCFTGHDEAPPGLHHAVQTSRMSLAWQPRY